MQLLLSIDQSCDVPNIFWWTTVTTWISCTGHGENVTAAWQWHNNSILTTKIKTWSMTIVPPCWSGTDLSWTPPGPARLLNTWMALTQTAQQAWRETWTWIVVTDKTVCGHGSSLSLTRQTFATYWNLRCWRETMSPKACSSMRILSAITARGKHKSK